MATSKFVKANEKIAETVTDGFQKLSDHVVGSYQKVEDAFVDRYLTKDGESVEDAKVRLEAEQSARKEAQSERKRAHDEKIEQRKAAKHK